METRAAQNVAIEVVGRSSAGPSGGGAVVMEEKGSSFEMNLVAGKERKTCLSFLDLNYKIIIGKGKAKTEKHILQNVGGYIPPATFVAIMGPTGSGKTSLLNVLGGRVVKGGILDGQVLVNGKPRDSSFKRMSAYVMQDDVLYHTLSVRETLMVAAKLRLPSSVPTAKKRQLVENLINELSLNKASDTWIGNDLVRGVSGGERKRTNIAVELLSDPSLLFLDEPTSGLDSFQALNVMSTLKNLAVTGRTIISTIHQPRSSIFALFEYLLLLSEGEMVYFGRAQNAIDYFSRLGYRCPEHFNPADYFMDIISMDRRDEKRERESAVRMRLLADSFVAEEDVRISDKSKAASSSMIQPDGIEPKERKKEGKFPSRWHMQFITLLGRSWTQVTRDKLPIGISFVQAIIMSLVVGSLFSNTGDGQKSIQDREGSIFFVSLFVGFGAIFQMITTFPYERAIVNRERAANSYRISAFYPAKVISEWPLRIVPTIIFVTVVYWMTGFDKRAERYFVFIVILVFGFTAMYGLGILIGSIAPTPQVALALGPLTTVILMLFGGFYINLDNIPTGAKWVVYCSPIMWMFTGAAHNQFDGLTFRCDSASEAMCIKEGKEVLKRLSIENYSVGRALLQQAIIIVVVHTLACVMLTLNKPRYEPLTLAMPAKGDDKEASDRTRQAEQEKIQRAV